MSQSTANSLFDQAEQHRVVPHIKSRYDTLCHIAIWVVLCSIFVLSVWRARTQPIAHDEAWTFVMHLSGGAAKLLKFSPNNHVLFTLAAAAAINLFGVSEFALRLPSLFGLLAYLLGSYLLCRRIFRDWVLVAVVFLLLVCHPLALDFLVAARGYGLALGFLLLAMACFADLSLRGYECSKERKWEYAFASFLLGLSVAANLSYLIPAASLTFSFAIMTVNDWPIALWKKLTFCVRWLIVPGATTALFVLWPYVIQVQPSSYDFGYDKLTVLLREFVDSSILYKWTDETYANLGAVGFRPHSWQYIVSSLGSFVCVPLLVVSVFAGSFPVRGAKWSDRLSETATFRRLFCGATSAAILTLCMFHFLLRDKYPVMRGCLYLIPLFTISAALIAEQAVRHLPAAAKVIALSVALLIGCDYIASLQIVKFRYNAYDARSREAFLTLFQDVQTRGLKKATLAGTWWYQPEMDFYRIRYGASQIGTYDVIDGPAPDMANPVVDYDYLCFLEDKEPDLKGRNIRIIFRDAKTGIVIGAIGN